MCIERKTNMRFRNVRKIEASKGIIVVTPDVKDTVSVAEWSDKRRDIPGY